MNVNIIDKKIRKEPSSIKNSYIFVNDNRGICENIVTVGFSALYISKEGTGFFTAESFCQFVRDVADAGTYVMSYTFVLACFRKKTNDMIAETLKNNQIPCQTGGWSLFRDKEYLGKYDKQTELEQLLEKYIGRFEGGDTVPADKLQFCVLDADGVPRRLYDIKIIRYLMDVKHMFVMGQQLYIYRSGCYYLDDNGTEIKAEIQGMIPDQFINHRNLQGLYSLLLSQNSLQRLEKDINQYPAWWINFQNGMFDVKEKKLRPHKPQYYSINQIPHILDMGLRENLEAAGVQTMKFLDSAIPDKADQLMMWQYLGYSMTRDTSMQRMMFLKGDGGTGKSRLINLFQEVIGYGNYSGVSLENINERFYPSMLFGKLLNACADIEATALMSVDNIKKATGEDTMVYEKKGKDAGFFNSYAKLLFSANKIPVNLDEKSSAWYRRLLVLEMNRKPEKKDRDLDEKLKAEIGFSIWQAVGALDRLYGDGEFAESQNSKRIVEELYREADSAKAFMDECTVQQEGSRIYRTLLYDKYKEYCQGWGRKELSSRSFFRRVEELGYRPQNLSSGRYFRDISFRDDGFFQDEGNEGGKVFSDRPVTGK